MKPSHALAVSLVWLSASSVARAQSQPTPPPQFKTEVSAVVVDVLVLDKEGKPVAGLKKEDFTLYEDDARQTVDSFDVIDWMSYTARAREERAGAAPTPGTVNAFPRRFAFVVNRQGAKFGFIVRAKKALENFIVESMAEGDEAMVMDIGLSTRVLQEFVDSKEETLRTVRKLTPMEIEVDPGVSFGAPSFGLEERATRNVYDSLEALGDALAGYTGRKILVLMSPELNRTHNLISYLRDTVNALNRSNTTVYSIDIRGVETVSADTNGAAPLDPFLFSSPTSSFDSFELGGLYPLADQTGGRYFYNLNTFEPAVRRVGTENQRYYVLTYVPSNGTLDGKYRKIRVNVTRADLTVVARRGYYARKPKPGKETTQRRTPAAVPVPARAPATGAALRPPAQVELATYLLAAPEGKVEVPITVALPLSLLQTKDGAPLQAELALTIKDPSGKVVDTQKSDVDPEHFYVVKGALLSPGNYLLESSLLSQGKVIHRTSESIAVPENLEKRFGLSSIVPVTAPAGTGDGSQSMKSGPLPVRPSTTFSRGEDALLYFRIVPGGERLSSEGTKIVFTIFRNDEEVKTVEPSQTPRFSGDAPTGYPILMRVPTADLAPGRYRVEVRVASSDVGKRAASEIEITIQ